MDISLGLGGLAGGIGGAIAGIGQRRRDMSDRRALMEQQTKNQERLNRQGQQLGIETWNKTNAKAQVDHLKRAGLNVGLMYGGSGAGGATTSSGSGGSAGSAPSEGANPMDMALRGAQTGLQAEMMKAQIDNINADTEKKRGVDTQEGQKRIEGIEQQIKESADKQQYIQAQTTFQRLLNDIKSQTKEDQIDSIIYQTEKLGKEVESIGYRNQIDKATVDTEIEKQKTELTNAGIQGQLMKMGIRKGEAEIVEIGEKLKQGLRQLELQNSNLKARLLEGKVQLNKNEMDYLMKQAGIKIDFMKLNVEQQKIWTTLFGNVLGARPRTSATTTQSSNRSNKGWSENTSTTTRTQN